MPAQEPGGTRESPREVEARAGFLLQRKERGGVAFGCLGLVLAYDGESTDGRGGQGMGKFLGRKPADLGALVIPHERCSIVVGGRADEKLSLIHI